MDDGSTDGTGAIADALAASYPFLRVIHHRRNQGLTAALRTGFAAVRGDLILFLPADLESDPEIDIPMLLGKLDEGYDVVAGWRQGRKEGKVFASGIYNTVSRWLFGLNIHDMNWIKGFRREVIETLPPLRSDWHRFLLHIAATRAIASARCRRRGISAGRADPSSAWGASPSRCSTSWSCGSCSPSAGRRCASSAGWG